MTIGSLFSGIGGLELGLERAGLGPVLWQVEADAFCRAVLTKHWPDAKRFDDVRTVGSAELCPVDIICGGFPCQDVSLAGKGAGLVNGERTGLWREFARIVRELQPRFVVAENVPGLIRRGLDVVVADLTDAGYVVAATRIAASDLGATHRRERLFIVAYRDGARLRHELGGGAGRVGPVRESLSMRARNWPTPSAKLGDCRRGEPSAEVGEKRLLSGRRNLDDMVAANGHHHPMTCTHGGKCRPTLNPRFVAWLMGFPLDWLDDVPSSKPSATPSFRRARKSSVKESGS